MYEMTIYIFDKFKPQYLLLGKFQTDPLEKRFGCYRQLSGANYHISLQQLLESEKKIRIKNLLFFSSKYNFKIEDLTLPSDRDFKDNEIEKLDAKLLEVSAANLDFSLPSEIAGLVLYIAGYASHSTANKKCCIDCTAKLINDDDIIHYEFEKECSFINECNRGRLKKPTRLSAELTILCYRVFQIVISSEYEYNFLHCNNQLATLIHICNWIIVLYRRILFVNMVIL